MKTYNPHEQTDEDLSSYWGRVRYFQRIITPAQNIYNLIIIQNIRKKKRNLFYSTKTIQSYEKILQNIKDGKIKDSQYTNEQLWNMRYIVDSSVHPQTKEVIPFLFRTSSYVLTNTPLMIVLSILPPTFFNQIIGQTLNQTYNFLFNYSNRNASNVYSNQELAGKYQQIYKSIKQVSYVGAVFFALVGSLGTIKLLNKMNAPSPLLRVGPILGVLMANSFNLFFTRTQDIFNGVDIYDNETKEVLPHKSVIAGKQGFQYTLAVRTATTLILFGLPPMVISLFANNRLYQKKLGKIFIDTAVSSFNIYVGLSAAISLYPQYIKTSCTNLEPVFQTLKNSQNKNIDIIYFNKGL